MKILRRRCATTCMRAAMASALLVSAMATATADNEGNTLRFKGGIGVIPVSSGQGTAATATVVNRNIVREVQPAGQPWIIDELDAKVRANGRITVEGKGLILAGGNNAGVSGGLSVFATLICQAAAPFTQSSTTLVGVQLSPTGDFRIDDTLAPLPPAICASPMLLIRNTANAAWFAVGIPRPSND
jgi:hypothetical protein